MHSSQESSEGAKSHPVLPAVKVYPSARALQPQKRRRPVALFKLVYYVFFVHNNGVPAGRAGACNPIRSSPNENRISRFRL